MKANIILEIIALIALIGSAILSFCLKEYKQALAWGVAALWCALCLVKDILANQERRYYINMTFEDFMKHLKEQEKQQEEKK